MYSCPDQPVPTPTGPSATTCSQLCSMDLPSSVRLLSSSIIMQIAFVMFEASAYIYRGVSKKKTKARLARDIDMATLKSA